MSSFAGLEHVSTVIIGAGQSGLSTAYQLQRRQVPFVILDANARIGDNWRSRWDSLRLFTPAHYDGLAGMPFPASANTFPTKDEMADYLEAYAAGLQLPVRCGVKVNRLSRRDGQLLVEAPPTNILAENVIVAMSSYQEPRVPDFASQLRPEIRQIHSSDYRNPAQLQEGEALVVGAGNSGAEIALEVARSHKTWLSGDFPGYIPFRIDGLASRLILARFALRFVFHRILTSGTPIGRKARPRIVGHAGPLIRLKPKDLAAAGVGRVERATGVRDGLPLMADGQALRVSNVIWCTGFHPGLSWVDLPIFGGLGEQPRHNRGIVPAEPGLFFVGLDFLYALSSTMVHGVARDAEFVADAVAARLAAGTSAGT